MRTSTLAEGTINIDAKKFKIVVWHVGSRRPWRFKWCEVKESGIPDWNLDIWDETRFKTADDALKAAVKEIYNVLCEAKIAELLRREIDFFVP